MAVGDSKLHADEGNEKTKELTGLPFVNKSDSSVSQTAVGTKF